MITSGDDGSQHRLFILDSRPGKDLCLRTQSAPYGSSTELQADSTALEAARSGLCYTRCLWARQRDALPATGTIAQRMHQASLLERMGIR